MKNLLSILIILLWLVLGYFYHQWSHACCDDAQEDIGALAVDSTSLTAAALPPAYTGPISFKWNDADAILSEAWADRKAELLAGTEDGKLLEIMGWYRPGETNNTKYENLGLARAAQVRDLFAELPDERVRILGRLVEDEVDSLLTLESVSFGFKVNNKNIVEVADVTRIYFPFNSTRKLQSATVEAYLKDVADRVKRSGEKIVLTGHTDNIGDAASNLTLGQKRADIIRDFLIGLGVDPAKVTADSKGDSAPVGDNNTAKGRAENRRTELKIVK